MIIVTILIKLHSLEENHDDFKSVESLNLRNFYHLLNPFGPFHIIICSLILLKFRNAQRTHKHD